jgi:hypothetical protein
MSKTINKKIYPPKVYAAYKGNTLIGLIRQEFGVRGGAKTARWIEPVRRQVNNRQLREYNFFLLHKDKVNFNTDEDMHLRKTGKHIQSDFLFKEPPCTE